MSVTVVNGGGILGSLGTVLGLGGALTGNPWLTGLGAGANAASSVMNGGAGGQSAIEQLVKAMNGWQNPASGNLAEPNMGAWQNAWQEMLRRERQGR